jgi:hypothetical protein
MYAPDRSPPPSSIRNRSQTSPAPDRSPSPACRSPAAIRHLLKLKVVVVVRILQPGRLGLLPTSFIFAAVFLKPSSPSGGSAGGISPRSHRCPRRLHKLRIELPQHRAHRIVRAEDMRLFKAGPDPLFVSCRCALGHFSPASSIILRSSFGVVFAIPAVSTSR